VKESKGNVEYAIIIAESLHAKDVLGANLPGSSIMMNTNLLNTSQILEDVQPSSKAVLKIL